MHPEVTDNCPYNLRNIKHFIRISIYSYIVKHACADCVGGRKIISSKHRGEGCNITQGMPSIAIVVSINKQIIITSALKIHSIGCQVFVHQFDYKIVKLPFLFIENSLFVLCLLNFVVKSSIITHFFHYSGC
jgi:hypothetical protein